MTSRRKGVTFALINAKGGVGKTTTAVSLAAGLAAAGLKALLVDLDAQASASLSLGLKRAELEPGAADAVLEGRKIRAAIRPTYVQGLDILPGGPGLASADLVLADVEGREGVLRAALAPVRDEYGAIVIDCSPSLGLLTVNALTAADWYLVPCPPDYLALEGLIGLLDAVDRIRKGIGKAAKLVGIVLTIADYRQGVTTEIGDMIRAHWGRDVLKTEIRINVKLKEAPSFGKTIFDYAAASVGAYCYRKLVDEVMTRAGMTA
jgi:chromosome partitioning protein